VESRTGTPGPSTNHLGSTAVAITRLRNPDRLAERSDDALPLT